MVMDAYVPFFFLAAGYFQFRRTSLRETSKRALLLFIPYVLWNTLYFFFMKNPEAGLLAGLLDYLENITIYPADGASWFIRDLIYLTLFTPLLVRIKPSILMIFLINLGVYHLLFCYPSPKIQPWLQNTFYMAGLLLGRFSLEQIKETINRHVEANLVIGISIGFMVSFWNYGKSLLDAQVECTLGHLMDLQVFGSSSYIATSFFGMAYGILLICHMSLFLAKRLPKTFLFLARLAPGCFFVYMGHSLILYYITPYAWFRHLWFISSICVFASLYAIYLLLKHFFPQALPYMANQRVRPPTVAR